MFTGSIGPVEVFFYYPEAISGKFYWPGTSGSLLPSSPGFFPKVTVRYYNNNYNHVSAYFENSHHL